MSEAKLCKSQIQILNETGQLLSESRQPHVFPNNIIDVNLCSQLLAAKIISSLRQLDRGNNCIQTVLKKISLFGVRKSELCI